jgi:hypothetical protein
MLYANPVELMDSPEDKYLYGLMSTLLTLTDRNPDHLADTDITPVTDA